MKNPFVIFNIQPVFNMDMEDLTNRYKALVRQYHPDVYASQDMSLQDINAAYLILKDPLKRAKCLLETQGIAVDEEKILNDPEILEEMFELKLVNDIAQINIRYQKALANFNQSILDKDQKSALKHYWRLRYLSKSKDRGVY